MEQGGGMSVHIFSCHYGILNPDERFRLILAASGRHDDVEQQKLISSGRRIEHSVQDHSPYAHAFDEVCKIAYLDLLEEAARYTDAWRNFELVSECPKSIDDNDPAKSM